MKARGGLVLLTAVTLLAGCDLSDDPPVVNPVGPTAAATAVPQDDTAAQIEASYQDAEERIGALLAKDGTEPLDVIEGTFPGGGGYELQVLSLQSTGTSLALHLHLLPSDGQTVDLSKVEGGLSGELGKNDRTIADIALVDEQSDLRLLPTVYREDVKKEKGDQRCLCSFLPQTLPPEGVHLTAHYVRPEDGFTSLVVEVPGAEPSSAIGIS